MPRALLRKLVDCPTFQESMVILDVLKQAAIPAERHWHVEHDAGDFYRILVPLPYLKAAIQTLQKALEESKSHAG